MEPIVLVKVGQGNGCLGAKMAKHRCKSSKKLPVLARVYILVMKKANEQDSCDECDGRLQIGDQQTYPCRISPQDSEKYVKVHDDDDDDDDEPTLGAAELKLGDPRFIFDCVRSMARLPDDTRQNAACIVFQFQSRSCSSGIPEDAPYYVSVPSTIGDSPMTLLIQQMDSEERSGTRDTSDCGCFYFKGTMKSASFESTRYPGCYMAYHSSSETLVLKHVTMKDGHTLPDDPDIKFRLPKLNDVVDCPLDTQEVVKALQTGLQEMDLSDKDSGLGDSGDSDDCSDFSDSVSASSFDDAEACPVVDFGTEHNTTSAGDIVEVS